MSLAESVATSTDPLARSAVEVAGDVQGMLEDEMALKEERQKAKHLVAYVTRQTHITEQKPCHG